MSELAQIIGMSSIGAVDLFDTNMTTILPHLRLLNNVWPPLARKAVKMKIKSISKN